MKKFRFSLRPVAVLRAHREQRAREAFAEAVHAFVKSERDLAATRARVAEIEAALAANRSGCFSAAVEVQTLAAYRREWEGERKAEQIMQAARTALNQRRVEYLEAHRKLEVVNRLEEKARVAYRAAVGREEQAEHDEFAGRRFATRRTLSAV